jgi:MOSC domain-containing protein YiiM
MRRFFARWRRVEAGKLVAIYIVGAAGQRPRCVESANCVVGMGLAGDRYATGHGHWKATDSCEVTLVCENDLLRAEARSGIALRNGEHRRNLVVQGLHLDELSSRSLCIGEVVLKWHRPRPPCGYLDSITARGMAKALGKGSGVCLRVLRGGCIRVGDTVEVLH